MGKGLVNFINHSQFRYITITIQIGTYLLNCQITQIVRQSAMTSWNVLWVHPLLVLFKTTCSTTYIVIITDTKLIYTP